MANRYASQQVERSVLRASADAVLACTPMTSLVTGVGLGATGYLLWQPGLAATGALVAAAGLYAERLQARALRRRRRAERMRNRHEVTELRRTIAQLRSDVDAFQRALLDTEAALAARALPLLPPVPAAPPADRPDDVADVAVAARPAAVAAAQVAPTVPPEPAPVVGEAATAPAAPIGQIGSEQRAVVSIGQGWVQTPHRDADASPLPAQRPSPFVRAFDTGGIPVLDPVPADRLTETSDALVLAALDELEADRETRRLAYGEAAARQAEEPQTAGVEGRGAA